MTTHGRTPDEPRTRRPSRRPRSRTRGRVQKDLAELQEPYDLPFPDDRWPQGRPDVRWIVVDQLRGWQPGAATVPGRAPGNRTHPRTRARPGSRTMTPTRKTLP